MSQETPDFWTLVAGLLLAESPNIPFVFSQTLHTCYVSSELGKLNILDAKSKVWLLLR